MKKEKKVEIQKTELVFGIVASVVVGIMFGIFVAECCLLFGRTRIIIPATISHEASPSIVSPEALNNNRVVLEDGTVVTTNSVVNNGHVLQPPIEDREVNI